jgi:ABC-2 type transport system permease protein
MTRTFYFYLTRSCRNRVVTYVKRLRRPKYSIPALAWLGYMYFFVFRHMFSRSRPSARALMPPDLGMLPLIQTGIAVLLFVIILLPWFWPGRGGDAIRFTEAEIQFLFPAPITRRALVRFRLVKMQLGILFGVLVSFIFFGRGGLSSHPVYFLAAIWLVYSFLALYFVAVSLTRMSLAEHRASGFKRQIWVLAALGAVIMAIIVWVVWFIPSPPATGPGRAADFAAWFVAITESGPAYYLLLPFRALIRPAFAPDLPVFLMSLAPALVILGLAYIWVMHTDVAFEEAALERAKRMARILEAAKGGGRGSDRRTGGKVRKPLFELAPVGFAPVAIFWKNLISIGRLGTLSILPALVVVAIGLAVVFGVRGGQRDLVPTMIGTLAAAMAAFLTFVGPNMIRDDLRSDLLQIDLLKTCPLPGWSVVLGELMAPAAFLAAGEWLLLLVAALVLPNAGKVHLSVSIRLLVGSSAAVLLPCCSLVGIVIQNAAVLILPGWVQLGKDRQRGVEAMGQNLISMIVNMLVLVLTLLPAGLIFCIIFIPGYMAGFGLGVLPIAALFAALVLLAEAGCAIFWLGRIYDKFDVSLEVSTR